MQKNCKIFKPYFPTKASIQLLAVTVGLFMSLHFSCTNKKVVHPALPKLDAPLATCDTIYVSYTCSVKPILQNNCYSCHSTAVTASGGVDLENFQSLKNYLKLYYRNDSMYGSKFYNIILQTPGTLSMPPTAKLSTHELSLIKKWLNLGAPEN